MGKHTVGPWRWSDAYPMCGSGEKTWSLIGGDGYGILSCDGVENSPQGLNDEPNALLIAASPDLLEALQLILPDAESASFGGPDIAWRLSKARSAISKATGEER